MKINCTGCVKVLTNFYSTPLVVGTAVEVMLYSHGGAHASVYRAGSTL
jgi:hypothetical protein